MRRKIPETPRYLLRVKGDIQGFKNEVKLLAKTDVQVDQSLKDINSFSDYFAKFGKIFIVAALLWFLQDIVAYSGTLFCPSLIARSVGINNGTIFSLIIDLAFIIPGGILAILTIDRVGRKPLLILGFIGVAVALLMFATLKAVVPPTVALVMYGMNQFFRKSGPSPITIGILGVEVAPTKVRTLVQAMAVAGGRSGAVLTSFVFPYFFYMYGESFTFGFLSAITFIAALTYFGIPETKAKPLETASGEDLISTKESIKQ